MRIDKLEGLIYGMNVITFNKLLYLAPDAWIYILQNDVNIFKFLWIYYS